MPDRNFRIRGVLVHDDALYKSTFYLLTYLLSMVKLSCQMLQHYRETDRQTDRQTERPMQLITLPRRHVCGDNIQDEKNEGPTHCTANKFAQQICTSMPPQKKNWTVNSRSDTRTSLVLIKASKQRRRLIVEKRACLVLAGGRMGGGRGRRQSTANDENTATTATAAAALLRNEWRQTSFSHASWSRTPSIERLPN